MFLTNFKESYNLFKKNLILLLPDLVSLLITYSLIAIIFFVTGFSDLMPLIQSAEDTSFELLKNFLSENITSIIVSALIFVIVTFIVGVGVTAIKFDMINDIINNKKVSLKSSFFKSNNFYWPIVLTRVCIFILFGIFLLLTILLGGLIYMMSQNFGSETAMIISLAVMLPIAGLAFLLLKLSLLFVYQIMFLKNIYNPIKLIKESFLLFKHHTSFVFLSGLFIFALSLVIIGAANLLGQLIGIIPVASEYLSPVSSIIQMLLSISVSLISSIYLFLQLKSKKD